jgi:hypothetical protein
MVQVNPRGNILVLTGLSMAHYVTTPSECHRNGAPAGNTFRLAVARSAPSAAYRASACDQFADVTVGSPELLPGRPRLTGQLDAGVAQFPDGRGAAIATRHDTNDNGGRAAGY